MSQETIEVILKGVRNHAVASLQNPSRMDVVKVPRDEFVDKLLLWLNQIWSSGKKAYSSMTAEGKEVDSREFHFQFFPCLNVEQEYLGIDDDFPKPIIWAWVDEGWAVADVEGLDWLFAKRGSSGYVLVSLPEGLTISIDSGDIEGEGVIYPAFRFPWPRPLWEGGKYAELGALYNELRDIAAKLDKANSADKIQPLQIICSSPQPYKGLGHQLRAQLEKECGRLFRLCNSGER